LELLPDGGGDGDSEALVFAAEVEGLFAGVADGAGGIDGRGRAQGFEDGCGGAVEFGAVGEVGGIDGEEDLADAGFAGGLAGDFVGGAAAGEHRGEHVQDEREAGAFPIADGEGALGGFDGGGVGREVAGLIVSAGNGELGAAGAIGG